jgi:hypothetical protein
VCGARLHSTLELVELERLAIHRTRCTSKADICIACAQWKKYRWEARQRRNFTSGRAVDVVQGSVVDRKRRLQVTVPTCQILGPAVLLLCAAQSSCFSSDPSKQTPGAHQPKGLGLHPIDKLPLTGGQ